MIEIIPKPAQKFPTLPNILFYFSLVLLLISICSFFILDYYQKQASQNLKDLETVINKGRTPEEVSLEKEILGYQKKIDVFSSLISSHKNISNLFPVLEKNTHPKAEFNQFSFNSENFKVVLSGRTESFQTLAQQILIFKGENLIKDFNLAGLSIEKEGGVGFNFNFFLNPEIFK